MRYDVLMTYFPWVEERANCSLSVIFERLKMDVQADVDAKNKIDGDNQFTKYRVGYGPQAIAVTSGEPNLTIDSVSFHQTKTAIEVKDAKQIVLLTATPTLSDDGNCRA
jgi:hypothetical protein